MKTTALGLPPPSSVGGLGCLLDDDVVAVSPASVYRVLKAAGRLDRQWATVSKNGTGFVQPLQPHEHWHIDISDINVEGTFYDLTSVLDGCSRSIVHWELRESMTEQDVEVILQKALEKHPQAKPRIISDNGPQFIARDLKEFIRLTGITHVRTSPYDPQSNGTLERWHGSLKRECIRPTCPASLDEARWRVATFVEHDNTVRLHSAIGDITPDDMLNGLTKVIHNERDRKLEETRQRRQLTRQTTHAATQLFPHRTMDFDLGGGYGSAEVPPERRPRGQDRCSGDWLSRRRPIFPLANNPHAVPPASGLAPQRQTFAARRRDSPRHDVAHSPTPTRPYSTSR